MANRLTQIATRTGDNGTTGLGDNTRVSKDSLRVHAMGDVDELNSNIGVLLCEDMPADVRAPCDPIPQGFKPGMSMGDLYSFTDGLLDQYGECGLRDATKARWVTEQGM